MIINFMLILSIFLSLSSTQECKSEMKRIGYYVKRPNGNGYFPVHAINTSLITHLICIDAQQGLNNPLIIENPKRAEWMKELLSLKKNSPSLKIILAVHASYFFPIKNKEQTNRLAQNLVSSLIKSNLDGLEFTWLYPKAPDKPKLVNLLKEIREEINRQARPLLLSIIVPANKMLTDTGYDVENINKYVDILNLMAYNIHFYSVVDDVTGHNSPLFKSKSEESHFATMNVKWQAESYVTKGMDKSKIVISFSASGETWTLEDENEHGVGAPAEDKGPFPVNSYEKMCNLLRDGYTSVYDEEAQAPYAYKGNVWISYDDERSIAAKTKWTMENGYGGVSIFCINSDDHNQTCGGAKYPLLTAAYNTVCK